MDKDSRPVVGTELKMNIAIEPIGDLHMEDYDFFAEFYTRSTSIIRIEKEQMVRLDADNYIAVVDTDTTGTGSLKCKLTAFVPDPDCVDGFRTEIVRLDAGVVIIK